ncbi:hypothetical protein [Natrinema sp. DC36]|uniref:hypothetical protein n=1 Tax=Natrinema sp. DC36 TaxID=2878680 RepID=UPI001CF02151|nr:hypothetical protein [Natrinema sp. DC36]
MSGYPSGAMGIDPRAKSAFLWGLVGFLSFLVLVQGYALLAEPIVTIAQALVLGLLVGLGSGVGASLLEPRLAARAANRAKE